MKMNEDLEAKLVKIIEAIKKGELTINFTDRTVSYRDIDDLIAIKEEIKRALEED